MSLPVKKEHYVGHVPMNTCQTIKEVKFCISKTSCDTGPYFSYMAKATWPEAWGGLSNGEEFPVGVANWRTAQISQCTEKARWSLPINDLWIFHLPNSQNDTIQYDLVCTAFGLGLITDVKEDFNNDDQSLSQKLQNMNHAPSMCLKINATASEID